jgi:hypothetical protein
MAEQEVQEDPIIQKLAQRNAQKNITRGKDEHQHLYSTRNNSFTSLRKTS